MSEALLCEEIDLVDKDDFYEHIVSSLTQDDKKLHPKYFYDKQGSEYFDQICALEEYYPYKTELTLLPKVAESLSHILTDNYSLIEFGAGSLLKVKPLLDKIVGIQQFIPIDISGEHLRDACLELNTEFPSLDVHAIEADFTQSVKIQHHSHLQRLGFFPGSTIGNLTPQEADVFLRNARKTLGPDSFLLIGVDTKKSPSRLHRAYNDRSGVTAAFNLNILHRVNRHFDSSIDVDKFEHYAFYNAGKGCVEMHLVCLETHFAYLDGIKIEFKEGETIHTESSYKYAPSEFQTMAFQAGWATQKLWLAENNMFSIFLLKNMS